MNKLERLTTDISKNKEEIKELIKKYEILLEDNLEKFEEELKGNYAEWKYNEGDIEEELEKEISLIGQGNYDSEYSQLAVFHININNRLSFLNKLLKVKQ